MSPEKSCRDPRPANEVVAVEGVTKAIGLKHVASVLYTYRCTLACKHCLFYCGPRQPDVHVSLADGLEFLRQLHAIDRVIHIAGGEASMYPEEMLELCQAANAEGVAPHFIETNGKWCVDDDVTRARFESWRDAGVQGALISADPFHQVFFPPADRLRALRLAHEVFGPENVMAADLSLEQLEDLREIGRDRKRLAEHVRRSAPLMVGRAADKLAEFLPLRPLEELAGDGLWHGPHDARNCAQEFDADSMWEIHLDPYGNVQTCCGIIMGNVHHTPLPEMVATGFQNHSEMVRRVYEDGPYGLLELAVEHGYEPAPTYRQKCHLCWEVRQFLRQFYPEDFGPAEVYEPPERRA